MASTRVIGLDIGSTCVRAAELEFPGGNRTGKNPPSLVRFGEVGLPLGAVRDGEVVQQDIVARALRQLWSQAKFESKDVVIGVGNQRVVVRELDLPWMPYAQIKESLAFQVSDSLPMSIEDALLDFYPTSQSDGPQGRMVHGMLVAAQRDTVSTNVIAVEAAGLHPTMVDLNAFALVRSLARGDLARGTTAFVDIGASVTTIVIADQGVPRLVRSLPSGGQNVTAAVAAAAGISNPEAEVVKREVGIGYAVTPDRAVASEAVNGVVRTLVESIRNTLVYYTQNGGAAIDVVALIGGGAHLPGLGQYLSSTSRLPVTLGDPLSGLRTSKTADRAALNGHESLIALSVGLAYGVAA
ncbi:type IV pilus assembly protein PilM [Cellulomonas edaphi]|uniref:Type IV pilus assembly protein PilM n=1 Tax=Cellulomonas edaphi TaxID=3053468 RepID=A0ABT7S6H2_9CELL|nr:type IV pilus assembly protein PilM [Cellulomons edaphi]MDM7831223.1 type IV pilus assembly protein PilM [Cellulomons edaphi]